MKVLRFISLAVAALAVLTASACLPSSPGDSSEKQTITLYGFSIMKESMEKDIFPAFKAKWKAEHGTDVDFVSSSLPHAAARSERATMPLSAIDRFLELFTLWILLLVSLRR